VLVEVLDHALRVLVRQLELVRIDGSPAFVHHVVAEGSDVFMGLAAPGFRVVTATPVEVFASAARLHVARATCMPWPASR
jgi:hypothetical protein